MAGNAEETVTLTWIARQAGVTCSVASEWLAKGLLPNPLPEEPRPDGLKRRAYRFDKAEANEALAAIQAARAKREESEEFFRGKSGKAAEPNPTQEPQTTEQS